LKVTVTNRGTMAAEDVAQLYVSGVKPSMRAPIASLRAFQRVALAAGASKTIELPITARMLAIVDEAAKEVVEKGSYRLTVGGVWPSAREDALGAAAPVQVGLTVR
jgi:beta-glucosidase